jgi:hypothetical protein
MRGVCVSCLFFTETLNLFEILFFLFLSVLAFNLLLLQICWNFACSVVNKTWKQRYFLFFSSKLG